MMNENNFATKISLTEQDVIEFYNGYADTWDNRFSDNEATRYFFERRWKCFLDLLKDDLSGKKAVELGVGTGVYIDRTSSLFKHILAVDGSEKMLLKLGEKLRARGIKNVDILRANVLNMRDISNDSIDVVYFFGLLEHIINKDGFIEEIKRILRPAGAVVGVTPNASSPWFRLRKRVRGTGMHCSSDRYYTKSELKKIFTKHGFLPEAIKFWGAVPAGITNAMVFKILKYSEPLLDNFVFTGLLGSMGFKFRKSRK